MRREKEIVQTMIDEVLGLPLQRGQDKSAAPETTGARPLNQTASGGGRGGDEFWGERAIRTK